MTKTVDVAANQKIASTWGNEIRDRTTQVFANAAERDAQWPTAPNGSQCVTLDAGVLWRRLAGAWVQVPTLRAAATAASGDKAAPVGLSTVLAVDLGIAPAPARVVLNGVCWFGFSSGFVNAYASLGPTGVSGGNTSQNPVQCGVAGTWSPIPMQYAYNVAAGVAMGYQVLLQIVQVQSGGANANASVNHQVFY